MNLKSFNWQIWAGLLLSVIALLSYPFFFVQFPLTRDFPWANLLLFVIALAFIFVGLKRAFRSSKSDASKRSLLSKVLAAGAAGLSVLVLFLFVFSFFIAARWLPASRGAPQVGQAAPSFTLTDVNGKTVSLAQLTSTPIQGQTAPAKGVLLIFYRGYW